LSIPNAGDFEPEKFEDQYEQALREIIEKKASGQKIERPKEPSKNNVVSLMDALRASVQAERSESGKKPPAAAARTKKTGRSQSKHKKAS
jgi:DNA end-binding protein Ku